LELARQSNISLLKFLSGLNEKELKEWWRKSFIDEFLSSFSENRAIELALTLIDRWKTDSVPYVHKAEIKVEDAIMAYQNRRATLVKFLPSFSNDIHTACQLFQEIDEYFKICEIHSLKVYEEVRKDDVWKQRQQLLEAQEIANLGSYDWDIKNEKTSVSRQLRKIFGHSADKVTNSKTFQEILHPEDTVKVSEALSRAFNHKEDYFCEYRIIREQDKKVRYVSVKGKVSYDPEGKPVRMLGTVLDITERKEIEDQLQNINFELEARVRERTKELQEAQRISKLGNWKVDWLQRKIFWSEEMFRIYEMNPQQGEPDFEAGMKSFEDPETMLMYMLDAINNSIPYNFDAPIITEKGNKKIVQIIGQPVVNENGECVQLYGTTMDVTDRKKAEESIKSSEEKYRLLTELIPQLVWITDAEGNAEYFNPNWHSYTGQTMEEAKGKGRLKAVHPDDIPLIMEAWKEAIANETCYSSQYRLKKHDGTYAWFMGKGIPIRNKEGKVIQWFGTSTDIHDMRLIKEELTEKNRQLMKTNNDLDNFIYTASHDLKSPISNLEGLLGLVSDDREELITEKGKEVLPLVKQSLGRLKTVIEELTEIARIQKDTEIEDEVIPLDEFFKEILLLNDTDIKNYNGKITADFSGCPQIKFSRKNLRSILFNLLNNAMKYSALEREGLISVVSEQRQEWIVLSISDNGLGIPEKHLDKIFTMFKRFHIHVEGSGVGLYIVKRIIENAGGKIEVTSKEGMGTTFTLYFKRH
ncbi:MAG: PAS domain-containing protein, partial [Cytophagaceae bacterium]